MSGRGTPHRHARSRARSWALQLLYGWELAGAYETPSEHAAVALAHRRISPRYRAYAEHLLATVESHLDEIDADIGRHAANWRIERLGAIDRNILRLGIAELRWGGDVPPRVAIQEAVRLAARYGGQESPGFVNGVLDAVFKGAGEES